MGSQWKFIDNNNNQAERGACGFFDPLTVLADFRGKYAGQRPSNYDDSSCCEA